MTIANLADLARTHARERGDRPALIETGPARVAGT